NYMPLQIREASATDYDDVERMVLESFGPITWARTLDQRFGPLNGLDWRARWTLRLQKIFAEQIVLVGEADGVLVAMASGTIEKPTALAYVDLLAVAPGCQRQGYGRAMLNGAIYHMRTLGAQYIHLDCLTNNDHANALYEAEGFEEVARQIRW